MTQAEGAVDITHLIPARFRTDQPQQIAPGNADGAEEQLHAPTWTGAIADFPCGQSDNGLTLCAGANDSMTTDYLVTGTAVAEAIPVSGDQFFQYGFVFDADGVPDNNYEAPPAYPQDFFDGTDLWYAVSYTPADGWSLQVTDARGGSPVSMSSDARVIISDNAMVLVAPREDIPGDAPDSRVTAFRHEGDWGANASWSGDVIPTVDEGLRPFE